jgi:hypothetical protein
MFPHIILSTTGADMATSEGVLAACALSSRACRDSNTAGVRLCIQCYVATSALHTATVCSASACQCCNQRFLLHSIHCIGHKRLSNPLLPFADLSSPAHCLKPRGQLTLPGLTSWQTAQGEHQQCTHTSLQGVSCKLQQRWHRGITRPYTCQQQVSSV